MESDPDAVVVSRKPESCTRCGFSPIADILQGEPAFSDGKLERLIDSGHIVLGGCIRLPDSPDWMCTNCGLGFRDAAYIVKPIGDDQNRQSKHAIAEPKPTVTPTSGTVQPWYANAFAVGCLPWIALGIIMALLSAIFGDKPRNNRQPLEHLRDAPIGQSRGGDTW